MTIDERSAKDEVISHAVELIDGQRQQIKDLRQQMHWLWIITGALAVLFFVK